MTPVRVLIVDDSAMARKLLSTLLAADDGIEVVGCAADPLVAREMIKQLNPDVLTLDVEMPRMDGLTFLENLMRLRPMPVVMVSSLTCAGADATLRALELGAVDFCTKPEGASGPGLEEGALVLCAKVKAAAATRPRGRTDVRGPAPAAMRIEPRLSADAVLPPGIMTGLRSRQPIIALGASTGGTEAIRVVLEGLPVDAPPVLVVQHIPAAFSAPFAARMDRCAAMRVCQAQDRQPIEAGHAYIAPGGQHLLAVWEQGRYVCRLHDGPPVNRHKPSVDVLFRSLAGCAGAATVAALLTGMGDDGARGLLELRQAGAGTLIQDQASSVVWGMPGTAWRIGGAGEMLPLDALAARLLELARRPVHRAACA